MALPTLSAVGPSSSTITDIVSMNWRAGRSSKSENFTAGTGSIVVRNPQNLPAAIVLEALITLSINGQAIAAGYVTDISYQYGYVQAEDIATISMEGYLARFGRGYVKNFLLGGGRTGYEATRLGNALTGSSATITDVGTRSNTYGPDTVTGDAQNFLAKLVTTEQGRLYEGASSLKFYGRDVTYDASLAPTSLSNFAFTDTNPSTTGVAYSQVEFGTLTTNYFTQVTVNPDPLPIAQAGTGKRNLQIDSFDDSSTQAADLANYTLAEFDSNVSVPVSVSTEHSLQWALDPAKIAAAGVAYRLPITFRGSTYNTVIEGWSVAGDPNDVRYTFYVSDYRLNNFFILDDPIYGRLDYNKLSF